MSKYLVTFSSDWADEFQAEGLAILDDSGIDEMNAWLEADQGFYFGTNEGFEDGEITLRDFTIAPITDDEVEILTRLIPRTARYGFGQFPSFEIDDWQEA